MNNQLQIMPVQDMMTMAKTFADSGLFESTKDVAKAFVKMQAGAELGIPPFASMSGIHIIAGKPVLGAGLLAGKIKSSGKYDYKVLEQSDKKCSLDFYQGAEKLGNSTFTIEDAKKAGTKNIDKFPANMLFARAISNGVKWFTPDVYTGVVYVPGEIEETEDVPHTVVTETKQIADKKPATAAAMKKAIDRIASGEEGVRVKMQGVFSLTEEQDNDLMLAERAKADENAA